MILARSPYIIEIDETNQTSTKVELFLWNGTGAAPALPAYVLSKKVPSTNQRKTFYDIAPYIREYFKFYESYPYETSNNVLPNEYAYCNVKYITYSYVGTTETILDEITNIGLDGYGYYSDGYNPSESNLDRYLLSVKSPNVYNYPCSDGLNSLLNAGTITILGTSYFNEYDILKAVYTPLDYSAASIEVTITQTTIVNLLRVHLEFYEVGNKLEIIGSSEAGEDVLITYYFQPICECKYDVMTVDFINRFGAWQREFFYKASNETLEVTNNNYKTNPVAFPEYNTLQGQVGVLNTNGKQTYKVNSGWVEESFKDTIQELLLSETIRLNGKPATLKTKSVEKYKSINTKTINYQVEFEMAYDLINSVN